MSDRDSVPRWVLWVIASVVAGWLLYTLRGVLAPFFFAFLIAYMLDPLVDRVEETRLLRNSRVARGIGIAVLLIGVFGVTAVLLFVVAPMVFEQISSFVQSLPGLLER
ncbi:MAG: AI-2E family transporter, partial [Myxococcales bacterium]|nr:AI-2E family transporter [Myxococcales bacterium]